MKPRTIVFDLDGTLVDTAPDLAAVANAMLAERAAPPLAADVARVTAGQGVRAMMGAGLTAAGLPLPEEDEWPAIIDDFIARYVARIAESSRPFKGMPEVLETLLQRGHTLAVCTNKRRDLAEELLRALNMVKPFAAIVGGACVDVRKPHPKPLLHAIELAGGEVSTSLFIGDSTADIEAARAAGVPSVLAAWGYLHQPPEAYGATHIAHAPRDLLAL
ncbi:MAG TPA: HAD family hydrolase [Thermopetrobacter sp.]|nr:HAD family hydrolase [Thermopetrobacter sp.]